MEKGHEKNASNSHMHPEVDLANIKLSVLVEKTKSRVALERKKKQIYIYFGEKILFSRT